MHNYFNIEAVSNSFLSQVKRELLDQPSLNPFSPALRDGDAIHKLLLEPHNFDFRKYSGRERMAFMKMQNSFMTVAGAYLDGEKEVEYQYEYMGFRCKMKADIVNKEVKVITDLKTTRWNDHGQFMASALEYDYHRQAAWYLDAPPVKAEGITKFRIFALCKTNPYLTFLWEADSDNEIIEAGREDYMTILSHIQNDPKYNHLKTKVNEFSGANLN